MKKPSKQAVGKAINEVLCRKDTFPSALQENIGFVSNKESDKATNGIDIKLSGG